jgi:hypothetical protein
MAFCPQIDGNTPTSSKFAYIMGLEPLQLTATISADTPPSEITYQGQSGVGSGLVGASLDFRVVSWQKINSREYMITAYNEPFFWKLNKISIDLANMQNGYTRAQILTELKNHLPTGWDIDVEDLDADATEELEGWIYTTETFRERFAFVDYSGSFLNALKLYEDMTGMFGYIDHVNKTVKFVKEIPTMDTFGVGEYLKEHSEANTVTTEEIIMYGNLNHIAEINKNAVEATGIDSYESVEILVDGSSWSVESEIELSSYSDTKVGDTGWENVGGSQTGAFEEDQNTTVDYRRVETYVRSFEPVVTSHTSAIVQDEVMDMSPREGIIVTPDGEEIDTSEDEAIPKQNKSESDYLKVEYDPPTIDTDVNDNSKKLVDALKAKNIMVAPICGIDLAETRSEAAAEAIKMDVRGVYSQTVNEDGETQNSEGGFSLGANPKNTIYVIPYREESGNGNARSHFSLSAYVISALPVNRQTYYKVSTKTVVNGQASDIDPVFEEPPTIGTTSIKIANVFRGALLKYLKFDWSFSSEAKRVKFPYAVSSLTGILDPEEEITDNVDMKTLVVQNNFVSTLAAAQNKARLLKKISNMDVEEGWLVNSKNVDFEKCSKYVEIYNSGTYKAIEYIRKEPEEE